jgi:hypothetical protein
MFFSFFVPTIDNKPLRLRSSVQDVFKIALQEDSGGFQVSFGGQKISGAYYLKDNYLRNPALIPKEQTGPQ